MDIFGTKRAALTQKNERQTEMINDLMKDVDQYQAANQQIADEYTKFNKKTTEVISEKTQQLAALKEESLTKSAQISSLGEMRDSDAKRLIEIRETVYLRQASIEELEAEIDDKDEEIKRFKRKSEDLSQKLCLMDDRLGEAQDDACELTQQLNKTIKDLEEHNTLQEDILNEKDAQIVDLTKQRNKQHIQIMKKNNCLDATHEWIGMWAERTLKNRKVHLSDIQQIVEGWTTPNGRYPWDE